MLSGAASFVLSFVRVCYYISLTTWFSCALRCLWFCFNPPCSCFFCQCCCATALGVSPSSWRSLMCALTDNNLYAFSKDTRVAFVGQNRRRLCSRQLGGSLQAMPPSSSLLWSARACVPRLCVYLWTHGHLFYFPVSLSLPALSS